MKKTETTNFGAFTTEPPIMGSHYTAPKIKNMALENASMLCTVSVFDGNGNEGLTEDETGNDYD